MDGRAEELDRAPGEEQTTVGRARRKDAGYDRLPKRVVELREEGRRRRLRPREDCVKRDVRKAGEGEDWKKKTIDRGGWKILSDEALEKLRAAPQTP